MWLRHLVEQIAMVFGAPIRSFGTVDLLLRDAEARAGRDDAGGRDLVAVPGARIHAGGIVDHRRAGAVGRRAAGGGDAAEAGGCDDSPDVRGRYRTRSTSVAFPGGTAAET